LGGKGKKLKNEMLEDPWTEEVLNQSLPLLGSPLKGEKKNTKKKKKKKKKTNHKPVNKPNRPPGVLVKGKEDAKKSHVQERTKDS